MYAYICRNIHVRPLKNISKVLTQYIMSNMMPYVSGIMNKYRKCSYIMIFVSVVYICLYCLIIIYLIWKLVTHTMFNLFLNFVFRCIVEMNDRFCFQMWPDKNGGLVQMETLKSHIFWSYLVQDDCFVWWRNMHKMTSLFIGIDSRIWRSVLFKLHYK